MRHRRTIRVTRIDQQRSASSGGGEWLVRREAPTHLFAGMDLMPADFRSPDTHASSAASAQHLSGLPDGAPPAPPGLPNTSA